MRYSELDNIWKKIYMNEWESLCHKSKAIAALIVDEDGNVISEGRNKIGEATIPNPRVSHAEVEAIRNLDIEKYPNVNTYVLYTALEPCPMCMGTMVMGGLRKIVIGTHDDHGGAMSLIEHSTFLVSKKIAISWMPQIYGDIQRGLQAIKELLYNKDNDKLNRMLKDFSVYNQKGVDAAVSLVNEGLFSVKTPAEYDIEYVFNRLAKMIENS